MSPERRAGISPKIFGNSIGKLRKYHLAAFSLA
jgi:hypothetical protein